MEKPMKKANYRTKKEQKSGKEGSVTKRLKPALDPEARENQMIALAVDLAEKQLMEGTASSQVITHYLKLATSKERLEKELLEQKKELMSAKTEALKSAKRVEELYADALKAMKKYSGAGMAEENIEDEVNY